MKKCNKLITLVLAAVCALTALFTLTACKENDEAKDGAYEVIVSNEKLVIFKAVNVEGEVSVYDAMVTLQDEKKITFDGYTGDYGYTVTEVNGTKMADDWSSYWGVYTTLGEYEGVTYATEGYDDYITGEYVDATYTYDGVKYLYASYGVSGMPVISGYSYVLRFVA